MTITELFNKKTGIDYRYFLTMVLEFIYPDLIDDSLSNNNNSMTLLLDTESLRSKATGKINISDNTFTITKID